MQSAQNFWHGSTYLLKFEISRWHRILYCILFDMERGAAFYHSFLRETATLFFTPPSKCLVWFDVAEEFTKHNDAKTATSNL